MSDSSDSSVSEANAGKSNRLWIILLLTLCLCFLALIGAIIAMFFYKGIVKFDSDDNGRFSFLTIEERADTSFDDVVDICHTKNKKLPVPMNNDDEKTLINHVKKFHKHSLCDNYLIGYRLDPSVRYESIDKKTKWPPLKNSVSAAIPKPDRDCILIKLKSDSAEFKVGGSRLCHTISDFRCVVGYALTKEYCEVRRMWCLYAVDVEGYSTDQMFASFQSSFKRYDKNAVPYGILLLDTKHQPLDVANLTFPTQESCYALEVNYVLNYINIYTNETAPYKINVRVVDPEMDCLVVSKDTFEIQTAPCSRNACALCE